MKPIGSLTGPSKTTSDMPTGTQRGELVVATGDNSPALAAAASQAVRRPRCLDEALLSQMSSRGAKLSVKTRGLYPTGPNGEQLPMRLISSGADCEWLATARLEDQQAALADIQATMTPAPRRWLEAWIAELSAITAPRRGSGIDAAASMTAYASRLERYPADVARYALLGATWKWFPTWQELERICEEQTSTRRVVHEAVALPMPTEDCLPGETPEQARERRARCNALAKEVTAGLKSREDDHRRETRLYRLRNRKARNQPLTEREEKELTELEQWEAEALR